MTLRTVFGTAAALLIAPGLSIAQFNYTSAEFNYLLDAEIDGGPDGDGFGIGGSLTVADSFFVDGSYEDLDLGNSTDVEWLEIGGGYFHALDEDLDFVASLRYVDLDGPGAFDDDGLALGGGIRARLADSVEVDAMLEHIDMDRGDSDTGIEIRGRYYISEEFAVQAKANFGTDVEIISIGIRGEF